MSRARHQLTADDELLLGAIGRRLAAIDDELPRLRPWRSDRVAAGQLHVVRGRTRRARTGERGIDVGERSGHGHRRIRVDVAAAGMAAVLAVAFLAVNRGAEVGRPAIIAAATPPGPAFSFGPGPSISATNGPTPSRAAPTPTASVPPVGPETGAGPVAVEPAGVNAVLGRLSWRCGVLVEVGLEPLASGLIDKLAATVGDRGGFLPGALGPGWIGSGTQQAARAFKARSLLTDAVGSLWVVRGDGQVIQVLQLVPQRSASGVTVWRSADVLWQSACEAPETDLKKVIVDHRPMDWPTGRIVDVTVVRLTAPAIAFGRPS